MKKRNAVLLIILALALLLSVVLGPAVYILYQRQTHQPQIETLYQAVDRESPEKIVYEIPESFRRDYRHLYLCIEAQEPGLMGCSIEYVLANGEKISSSFKESSSFNRYFIPYDHIKTVRRIELSELDNISRIELWNTFIEP